MELIVGGVFVAIIAFLIERSVRRSDDQVAQLREENTTQHAEGRQLIADVTTEVRLLREDVRADNREVRQSVESVRSNVDGLSKDVTKVLVWQARHKAEHAAAPAAVAKVEVTV